MAMQLRNDWLEQTREEILEPDRPIVDPHHHFFRPGGGFPAYDLEDRVVSKRKRRSPLLRRPRASQRIALRQKASW